MSAEQMFIVNEFIEKYATKNVWNVSDELFKLVQEVVMQNNNKNVDTLLPAEQCID